MIRDNGEWVLQHVKPGKRVALANEEGGIEHFLVIDFFPTDQGEYFIVEREGSHGEAWVLKKVGEELVSCSSEEEYEWVCEKYLLAVEGRAIEE